MTWFLHVTVLVIVYFACFWRRLYQGSHMFHTAKLKHWERQRDAAKTFGVSQSGLEKIQSWWDEILNPAMLKQNSRGFTIFFQIKKLRLFDINYHNTLHANAQTPQLNLQHNSCWYSNLAFFKTNSKKFQIFRPIVAKFQTCSRFRGQNSIFQYFQSWVRALNRHKPNSFRVHAINMSCKVPCTCITTHRSVYNKSFHGSHFEKALNEPCYTTAAWEWVVYNINRFNSNNFV